MSTLMTLILMLDALALAALNARTRRRLAAERAQFAADRQYFHRTSLALWRRARQAEHEHSRQPTPSLTPDEVNDLLAGIGVIEDDA